MALYAISDLHLSFGVDKPMNVFGNIWSGYEEKIKANWIAKVKEEDTVLIPGDISWGIDFNESIKDFRFINDLPGKKVLLKGNHDYYFSTKTKVENFFKENNFNTLEVLYNNAFLIDNYIVCGTRGWSKTESSDSKLNEKIIAREEGRLRLSLNEGVRIKEKMCEDKDILVAFHFPPFVGNFQAIMKEYNVKKCIYGHLHGYAHKFIKEGVIDEIEYIMVSCDYTNFDLVQL